ncbi:MAG TPA: hypothetical protein VMH80_19750 [Bryobacteraceae bacterium]|nr:hypothetical protein [Bryobacteraceae bacterium]
MGDTVAVYVGKALLIFTTNNFENVRLRKESLRELDAEGLRVHLEIVKSNLDVQVPE